jgi:hypothetical protein
MTDPLPTTPAISSAPAAPGASPLSDRSGSGVTDAVRAQLLATGGLDCQCRHRLDAHAAVSRSAC